MELMRHLRIAWTLFKLKQARNMAFRFSFFGAFFVDGSMFLIQILMFSAIYSQVESIGGWDRSQMLFFIGTFSIINALSMTLAFFGLLTIPGKIKSGRLDLYITRPVNSLFYLSLERIDLGSVPLIFGGMAILFYAVSVGSMEVTLVRVLGYTFLVLLMTILYYDLEVIFRTIPFFVIQTTSIDQLEGELIVLCMKVPGVVFKGAFKLLFYLLLPYGIMATIPTQFFSGTLSPLGFTYAVGITVAFTAFTLAFWRYGLRNYKSATS